MAEKYLQVTLKDGQVWEIPAWLIAKDRAEYYAGKEDKANYLAIYDQEFVIAMKDDNELLDWAANNMEADELYPKARRIKDPQPIEFKDGYADAELDIVEH